MQQDVHMNSRKIRTYLQLAAVEDNCKGEAQDLLELLKLHVPGGEKAQLAALENVETILATSFFSNSCTWKLFGRTRQPLQCEKKTNPCCSTKESHGMCCPLNTYNDLLDFLLAQGFWVSCCRWALRIFLVSLGICSFLGVLIVTEVRAQCRGECREVMCYLFEQRPCLSGGPFWLKHLKVSK